MDTQGIDSKSPNCPKIHKNAALFQEARPLDREIPDLNPKP